MTLQETTDYFEEYAKKHVDLKHDPENGNDSFFCLNTEDESIDFIRNLRMDLIMVLLPYDKSQTEPRGENYNWNKNSCFFILKRCDPSDKKAIIAAQSLCETIADDFSRVMIADRYEKLNTIESGSISMAPVGPIVDGHYGYMCMFNIIDRFAHWVDPARWTA